MSLPPPTGVRGIGGALVHDLGGTVGQRAVDDVAVAGDPADVSRAPVHVGLGVQVEDVLVGECGLREVAAARVQDALRLARRAGGVQDEQRVLGLERLGLVLGRGVREGVVPPDVAVVGPRDVVVAPLHDEDVLDRRGPVDRGIDGVFEREDLALAPAAVGRDDELRLGVVDARPQGVGAESTEDDRVDWRPVVRRRASRRRPRGSSAGRSRSGRRG